MAKIRPPGMGPRVGHTTSTSCKIWVRAGSEADDGVSPDSEHRTVGVIALMRRNGRKSRHNVPQYFRLRREYDRTGVIDLGRDTPGLTLEADTEYVVKDGVPAPRRPLRRRYGGGERRTGHAAPELHGVAQGSECAGPAHVRSGVQDLSGLRRRAGELHDGVLPLPRAPLEEASLRPDLPSHGGSSRRGRERYAPTSRS